VQENSVSSPSVNCIIALGSNQNRDAETPKMVLGHCLNLLNRESITISSTSRFYSTPAFPVGSGPNFVNAVALLQTRLSPIDLLTYLHEIEQKLGRTRNARWEQRVIDVDLISYDNMVLPNIEVYSNWANLSLERQKKEAPNELILPHPRIADRPFVLVPLRDVAPDWVHPVTGRSVDEMLSEFSDDDLAEIVLFDDSI
jgi:2-amino-4-hydroxy-6-hydroxymethyldihydropteridine diphosphokinase